MSSNKNQGYGGRPLAPQHGGSIHSTGLQNKSNDIGSSLAPQHGGKGQPFYTNDNYLSSSSSDNISNSINGYNAYSSGVISDVEDILVVEGGICKCNEGEKETGIKATTTTATTFGTKIALTTSCITMEEDVIFGECKKLTKEKQQKEKDKGNGNWEKDGIVQCKGKYKPVPEEWKPAVTTVTSNGEEVISIASQLICEHGGIISIVKNGQGGEFDHREEILGYFGELAQGMLTDAELSTLENFFNRSIFPDINAAFEGLFYSGSKGYYGNLLAKGQANLTRGLLGKSLGFVGPAITFFSDINDNKTVGQATGHAVVTTGLAYGITVGVCAVFVINPVGWAAVGLAVGSGAIATIMYDNNFLFAQDLSDSIANLVDNIGECITDTYDNIISSFGW